MVDARDPWGVLKDLTAARVALGRAGGSLPTDAWLDFKLAHARARDAVQASLDVERLEGDLRDAGFESLEVRSAAPSVEAFLRRPDLGRRLADGEGERLGRWAQHPDVALVASGGLSAHALHRQLVPLLAALGPLLEARGFTRSPVILTRHGRVALGDPIGAALKARSVLVLVGERPGLGTPASLGAYLTFEPRSGRSDAERNCVSNIHEDGLGHTPAAHKLSWLIGEALRRKLSGVELKDEQGLLEAGTGASLSESSGGR